MNTHYKVQGKALQLANAFGFLFPAELFLIQAIAQSLPEGSIAVNIGAGVGTGALALAEIRPDLELYTVDISEGGPLGGMQNEENAFRDESISHLLPHQILGNSQVVHTLWPEAAKNRKIDYIFIDADHSAEGLTADIQGWLPYLRTGGYALFHDYGSSNWPAVKSVVDRLIRSKTATWRLVHVVDTIVAFQLRSALK